MIKKQRNIGIITKPIGKAGYVPLSNLVDIVSLLSSNTYVITGNEGLRLLQKKNPRIHIIGIRQKPNLNIVAKILKHIYMQLIISLKIIKLAKNVDIWIFFLDSHALLLPVLTAKLTRKKIVFSLAASLLKSAKAQKDALAYVLVYSECITYKLANRIIIHSPKLIKEWDIGKYQNKISIAHEYFLDFEKFKIGKKVDERANLIGYVGRLSREKGVLNFVNAIPKIIQDNDDYKFLIGGDGPLRDEIKKYIVINNLNDKVKIIGWIPHDELPDFLNELKLLVIPSYTESGPIIALEAMACGTPILATRVGHVLNMVKDGETGFIMENNSSSYIKENVLRALNHPRFDKIVDNASEFIKKEFTYDVAAEKYGHILDCV